MGKVRSYSKPRAKISLPGLNGSWDIESILPQIVSHYGCDRPRHSWRLAWRRRERRVDVMPTDVESLVAPGVTPFEVPAVLI